MTGPLPTTTGRRFAADPSLVRYARGRVLAGGSPLRVIRLTEAGAGCVDAWLRDGRVGENRSESRLARRLLDAAMVHPVAEPGRGTCLGDVTVVVPVRDDPSGLDDLLTGLGRLLPVVVSDDGSTDPGEVESVAARHDAVLVARPTSSGPGAARNAGLGEVATDFVAFVDADTTITPDAITALLSHLGDPSVAAAAPRVRSRLDRPGLLAAYESVHSPLDLGAEPSPVGPDRRVRYVPAAALVVRTAEARAIGGFDVRLRWGEDVDFCWRLAAAGHTIRYEPAVVAWHRPRSSWSAWFEQRRRYGASAIELADRHGRVMAPARCSLWSVGVWGAVATGHRMIGAAIAVGSGAVLANRLRSRRVPGWPILACRLTCRRHLRAGLGLARALVRAWWPAAATAAGGSRRLRRAVLAALLVPPLTEWVRGSRPAGPVVSAGLRVTDDLAHGLGLWEAMVARRRLGPIGLDLTRADPRDPSRSQ